MKSTVTRLPSRRTGIEAFADLIARFEEKLSQGNGSSGEAMDEFYTTMASLHPKAFEGFMLAAGWWIMIAMRDGALSSEGIRRIIGDACTTTHHRRKADDESIN